MTLKVAKLLLAIFALIGLLVAMFGYFLNVAALIATPDHALFTTTFILRVVGIFVPPLGSVMGLFA